MEEESTVKAPHGRPFWLWLVLLIVIVAAVLIFGRGKTSVPKASISAPTVKSTAGHQTTVPIEIDTGGRTINAAEVYLKFDPKLIQIESASVEGSVFTIQITGQPKFSNETGEISFAGGVPNPGFKGKGKIGSVTLKASTPAKTQLIFDSKTQALLNDGLGTAIPLQLQPVEVEIK